MRPQFKLGRAISSESGLDEAKIAIIAWHTARLIYPRRGSLMRCFNSLLGCGTSLLGSAEFAVPDPGNFRQVPV
jgi:hypothetical protein